MLAETIVDNEAGWDEAALKMFSTFEGVAHVSASGLLGNGRFRYAHVFFPSLDDARAFADAALKAVPTARRLL